MSRVYTEAEVNSFQAVESELRSAGLIVDNEIGESNADVVKQYFETHPAEPVTKESIKAVCFGPIKDSLVWKTENEKEFDAVWALLSSLERGNFNSWARPQRLINNVANNLAILKYLKVNQRYQVDARTLALAAENRIASQLEWEPTPDQGFRRGHEGPATLFSREDKDPSMRGGKKNHAYTEPSDKPAPARETSSDDQRWWSMADQIKGRTHAHTEELMKIVRATGRKTYEARKAAALNVNLRVSTKLGTA